MPTARSRKRIRSRPVSTIPASAPSMPGSTTWGASRSCPPPTRRRSRRSSCAASSKASSRRSSRRTRSPRCSTWRRKSRRITSWWSMSPAAATRISTASKRGWKRTDDGDAASSPLPMGERSLAKRAGEGAQPSPRSQGQVDHLQHAVQVLIHIDVRDADDVESERFERVGALCIMRALAFCVVRDTVDLDDQLAFNRDEVDDVSAYWVLPSEFPGRQAAPAQRLPEPRFGARLRCAELARSLPEALHPPHPAAARPTSPLRGEV